jgi:hypothetical protein
MILLLMESTQTFTNTVDSYTTLPIIKKYAKLSQTTECRFASLSVHLIFNLHSLINRIIKTVPETRDIFWLSLFHPFESLKHMPTCSQFVRDLPYSRATSVVAMRWRCTIRKCHRDVWDNLVMMMRASICNAQLSRGWKQKCAIGGWGI